MEKIIYIHTKNLTKTQEFLPKEIIGTLFINLLIIIKKNTFKERLKKFGKKNIIINLSLSDEKPAFISLTTLIIVSCKHELERPTWDVEMIIPLAHTEMTINNIISDTNVNIFENDEGFIHLIL